jgi:hypothetical protein
VGWPWTVGGGPFVGGTTVPPGVDVAAVAHPVALVVGDVAVDVPPLPPLQAMMTVPSTTARARGIGRRIVNKSGAFAAIPQVVDEPPLRRTCFETVTARSKQLLERSRQSVT